jgi:glycogen(starch) synthase
MRVLMLGWEFPPSITGGLGVASEGLARGLLQAGAEVTLLLPRSPGSAPVRGLTLLDARAASARCEPDRLPRARRQPSLSAYAAPRVFRREAARAHRRRSRRTEPAPYGPDLVSEVLRYAEAAGRIARRERFDVIHAHDWLTYLAGLEARRVSGRPLAVHVHATELDRAGSLDNRFVADIEALGVRLADRVIAVSRYTAARVAEIYGVPPERHSVVHNANDAGTARHARRGRRPPLVLFAGRVTWQKGPGFFLEAAAIVAQEVKRARFAVAGTGDLLQVAMAQAEALGIRRRILFTGFLPPKELARLYAKADVFVLPSVSEPRSRPSPTARPPSFRARPASRKS